MTFRGWAAWRSGRQGRRSDGPAPCLASRDGEAFAQACRTFCGRKAFVHGQRRTMPCDSEPSPSGNRRRTTVSDPQASMYRQRRLDRNLGQAYSTPATFRSPELPTASAALRGIFRSDVLSESSGARDRGCRPCRRAAAQMGCARGGRTPKGSVCATPVGSRYGRRADGATPFFGSPGP